MAQPCSVNGCARKRVAFGWCLAHYKRWRRRGDVEDITAERQFFSHVSESPTGCWLWDSPNVKSGYGLFRWDKRTWAAHRWSYEFLRTEIPDGLNLDHLCRVRHCVNPWHVEPVTQRVNVLRGETHPAANAAKTHCHRGHPFDDANTYCRPDRRNPTRQCRECARINEAKYKNRRLVGAGQGG